MAWIKETLIMVIGGFVGYYILVVLGSKQRADMIRFFIFLMIAMSVLDHVGSATARISSDVSQVRQDIQAVREAGEKAGQLADAIRGAGDNQVVNFGASDKPLGTSFWDKINPFSGGKFSLPHNGKVTQGFSKDHKGIDIAANTGDQVRAARDGKVVTAGEIEGYGLTVIIDHGGGFQTLYAHNSKLGVKLGQRVFSGDAIALAGSTGKSTGPHLHFEIRLDKKAVDPAKYLK